MKRFKIERIIENSSFSLPALLIFGFIIRILYSILFPVAELHAPADSFYYDLSAKGVLFGEGYHELNLYAYRPPLYAFFLSLIYNFFGSFPQSYYHVIFVQSIISVLSVYYLYKLALELFNNKIRAFIAASLYCFFPTFIALNAEILTEPLFFSLFIPGFYYSYIGQKKRKIGAVITGAILFGLSSLTREITFYFYPLLITIFLVFTKTTLRNKIAVSTCMVLGFGAVVAPWMARNYTIFNNPLISTSGGINFYMGNNETATGFFKWKLPEGAIWANNLNAQKVAIDKLHTIEMATNKACYTAGINFIKDNPNHFLSLTLKKLIFFWLPPTSDLQNLQLTHDSILRVFRLLFSCIITILGAIGICRALMKRRFSFLLLFVWILYTTAFHAVVVADHRYSLTMIPFLCIFTMFPFRSNFSNEKKRIIDI